MSSRCKKYIILLAILALAMKPHAYADSTPEMEYQVKAAFLYNFAKFIEWPAKELPNDNSNITLCILGRDPFGIALDSINGKSVGGRKLLVKRYEKIQDIEPCHILFISTSEKNNLPVILSALQNRSVLTVSEMDNFTQNGGMINFITDENKIRFEINVAAAERVNLKISSKLANLAKIIRDKKAGEK